ncbi:imm11 family protein [Archangium violaceum]|nr:DUF1629 domain-containing protein [Archangium violaceum]
MKYMIGQVRIGRGAGRLKMLQGVEQQFRFHQGVSLAAGFPPEAHYEMNEKFPNDIKLEDFIASTGNLLVVSPRAKAFFEAEKLKNNELLPVGIINLKGRKEPEPYYLIHQKVLQECIDLEKTPFERNPINPEVFLSIRNIVLDESRIDPQVSLFRMRHYPFVAVYRDDLIEKIKAAGLTGIKFVSPSEFKG